MTLQSMARRGPGGTSGGRGRAELRRRRPRHPSPAIQYVEGRGIVFRTPDNLFEASLGFNLQVRFTHFDLDAARPAASTHNEFRVRRFKLFLSGFAFDPRLTWRFQAAFESTRRQPLPRRRLAQLEVRRRPVAPVRAVQDAVLARRALQRRRHPVSGARPRDRRLQAQPRHRRDGGGILLQQPLRLPGRGLRRRRAEHAARLGSRDADGPAGLERVRDDGGERSRHPESQGAGPVVRRAGFHNTLPKISDLGVRRAGPELHRSARDGSDATSTSSRSGEDVAIQSGGLEAQFKWHGLSVQGEYYVGQAEGKTSGVRLYAYGYYGQAGFFILPSSSTSRRATHSWTTTATSPTTASRWSPPRRPTTSGGTACKIVLDYSRTHRQRPGLLPANDQTFMIQAQLMP